MAELEGGVVGEEVGGGEGSGEEAQGEEEDKLINKHNK